MDIRGKGEQLGKDIEAYMKKKISYKAFLRLYGVEIVRIVENNFVEEMLDIYEKYTVGSKESKEAIQLLSSKISLFCSAFV